MTNQEFSEQEIADMLVKIVLMAGVRAGIKKRRSYRFYQEGKTHPYQILICNLYNQSNPLRVKLLLFDTYIDDSQVTVFDAYFVANQWHVVKFRKGQWVKRLPSVLTCAQNLKKKNYLDMDDSRFFSKVAF